MTLRIRCLVVIFGFSFCAGAGIAQDQPPTVAQEQPLTSDKIALTVKPGVPIHVALEKSLPIKQAGVPVEGHVVEPVYVFDHLVIPAGTKVLGHVTQVDELTRKQRALTIVNGDFTPYRKAYLDFDTLVLKDGKQLPLHAVVSQGVPNMVHLTAGEQSQKKKGRVSATVDQATQEVKTREQETVKEMTAPDKMQRLKSALVAELPYHKQSLPAGTQFTAVLKTPLELGTEDPSPKELEQVGGEIPPGSVVHVRLVTRLSSATDHRGSPVRAVVSEPLFSSDHHLILPEGTRLEGSVTEAIPARWLGRNGQLRFVFRQIELPQGGFRRVEASLQGVEAAAGAHVELDSEGGAHAVTPKAKYIAPAIDVVLAASSLDGLDPHNHHRIEAGLGPQGPDVAGGAVRGGAGFGLVGMVIGMAAHYRPVSAGFAFYAAGLSVGTHVMARGNDVTFVKNTPMEIRFGTHESSASADADPKKVPSEKPGVAKL